MMRQTDMNEEKYLIEKVGRQNPFRVPEGYFDVLAGEVMAKVDASVPKPRRSNRRLWYYAAACVCALMVSVATWLASEVKQAPVAPMKAIAVQASDDSFDEAADYVMVDNMDIYACLSSDY